MKRLQDLEPAEVSLVPLGAVKRKFLILKSRTGEGSMTKQELLDLMKTEPDVLKRVEKILKAHEQGLAARVDESAGMTDERAKAALKAADRILAPFKDKLPKPLIDALAELNGKGPSQGGDMEGKEGSATMSPEPVKEEHKIEAMKAAKAAYGAALAKMGYEKYPTQQIAQKEMDVDCKKSMDDEDEEEEVEKKKEGSTMPNADEKEGVMKSLLSNVPKETRSAIEAVFKSQQELIKKNEELSKALVETQRAAKRKEFVAKAAGFKHLGVNNEELADTMLALSETAPKQLEVVEKMLSAAEEQVSKGALFGEIGSSLSSGTSDLWEKIEKAAEGHVAKSGEKVSKAEAVDRFLTTAEGKRMYQDYMGQHVSTRKG